MGLDSWSRDGYDILQRGLVGNVWLPIWDPDIKLYEPEVLGNRVLGKRMSFREKVKGGSHGRLSYALYPMCHVGRLG